MKKHTEVTVWEDRIERSEKLRKKKIKETKVYIDFYKGAQWGDVKYPFGYKPTINLFFPHIKTQIPSLYFQNPKWYVKPYGNVTDELKQASQLAQSYLNHYIATKMNRKLKMQIRLAITDAHFWFGAVKSGYFADFETNENFGKPKIIGNDGETPIYDLDKKTGDYKLDGDKEIVKSEKFIVMRKSPASFIFDTECDNYFEEGRYIIEQIVKPLKDVKKNKIYENTSDLRASFITKVGVSGLTETDLKSVEYAELLEDLERVILYEIYDLENNKLKVIAEGGERFLRNESMPEGIDEHPYSFLVFNTIPDEIYPLSDLRSLKSIQEDYNMGRAMIMEHAKRFARKYGYLEGAIEEDELEKLKDPADGTLFKVKDMPLSKIIEPLQDAPLDPSVYANFEQSKQDFREVGGSTESERGVVERRKTAYEASKINEGVGLRKADRRSLVEDFMADAGYRLLLSMQTNLSQEDQVDMGGNWTEVTRDKIKGKMSVIVEVGSCAPKIPEFERQDIVTLAQVLPMFPPEIIQVKLNFDGLITSLARSFDTLEASELLNTPEVQKQKQDQIDKMKQVELAIKGGIDKPKGGGGQNAPV